MKIVEFILYGIGAIVLIISMFYSDHLPKNIRSNIWIIEAIILGFILIFNIVLKKIINMKNED